MIWMQIWVQICFRILCELGLRCFDLGTRTVKQKVHTGAFFMKYTRRFICC